MTVLVNPANVKALNKLWRDPDVAFTTQLVLRGASESTKAAVAAELAVRHHLAPVLAALTAAEIPALLIKGPALAHTAYPHPWDRPYTDVDLWVPLGMIERVRAALQPLGYRPAVEVTSRAITAQWHLISATPGALPLDVHERLVNPRVFDRLPSFADLYARSRAIPVLGPSARTLGAADTAWHLMVHAAAHHHGEARMIDACDLLLVTRRFDAADWNAVVETALRSGTARICGTRLAQLAHTVPGSVPEGVVDLLMAVDGEPTALFARDRLSVSQVEWSNFKALGLADRGRFVLAHLFPPRAVVAEPDDPGWVVPLRYVQRVWRGAAAWVDRGAGPSSANGR